MFDISTRIDDDGCVRGARCPQKVNYRQKEKEVLDQILGPGSYDARIRPSGVNGTGKLYNLKPHHYTSEYKMIVICPRSK